MLEIKKEKLSDDIILVKLNGKLIYDTEEEVNLTFEELIGANRNIFLDISKLNYINSSGLGIFINFMKNVKNNQKKLVLIDPSREVRMLFEITSLDKMFDITEDLEQAKRLIS
jgi:anti-sigma B factor antagonist